MIIPTLAIKVRYPVGRDLYGQPKFSPWEHDKCSPVRLDFEQMNSTVRTDSGATHGHAYEDAHVVVILVRANSKAAKMDAVLEILGNQVRVKRIHPRYTAAGKLDHYQLECGSWA